MKIVPTRLSGVVVVETTPFLDHRGTFTRLYCERELSRVINDRRIVQINRSVTRHVGAIRGMHFYWPPFAEMKLVRCVRGRVLDVAVDLRTGSPTFLQWHAEELSVENDRMLVIPEGFAHGFQVLEEDSEMLYLHTEFYTRAGEGRVRYNDPMVKIEWPLEVTEVSVPDREQPLLPKDFGGIAV